MLHGILERCKHFLAQTANGSGKIAKKIYKRQITSLKSHLTTMINTVINSVKATKKFGISKPMVLKSLKKLKVHLRMTMKFPDRTRHKKIARAKCIRICI